MSFGRYYDEFEVGDRYSHWPGRTITEGDHLLFCALTMNQHPLHIDAAYAAETEFKQRLVVGTLILSLVVGMSVSDVSGRAIANLGYDEVKHLAPTFHGDTIRAETEVLSKRLSSSRPGHGLVEVKTRGFNQRGEDVITLRRTVLVPLRPQPSVD